MSTTDVVFSLRCSLLEYDLIIQIFSPQTLRTGPDLENKIWTLRCPSMKEARPDPTVVTFDNKIYVFGFTTASPMDDTSLPNERWAEVYSDGAWTYLESSHPLELLQTEEPLRLTSHAVHESRRMVGFWVPGAGVYMFTFDSHVWTRMEQPISDGPQGSPAVALVQDYLFWHFCGGIYVYDFIDDKSSLLHTPKDAYEHFREPDGLDGILLPAFLAAIGKKLYLFYYRCRNLIECRFFTIQCPPDSRTVSLSPAGSHSLDTEGFRIQTVLAM